MTGFDWAIPERFNIGVDVTDRWAATDPDCIAIIDASEDPPKHTSFGELAALSNRFANLLLARGLQRGDRVAIIAPQRLETVIAHAAIYKAGAIAVPLFTLFGEDALRFRLRDSGTRFAIADVTGCTKLAAIRADLPDLESIIALDSSLEQPGGLLATLTAFSPSFTPVDTSADDPALIIYTSGTTGSPKGALHAHRVLLGHLPGVEASHGTLPLPGDRMWTPADWAWIGGLLDLLLPALHHGIAVVAKRFAKFDAAATLQLMQDQAIRNVFLPPTALRMLQTEPDIAGRWRLVLRSVASGGESLGADLLGWGRRELGLTINEFYGQTECNVVISSCHARFPARPGAIGKPVPGHEVAVIDKAGQRLLFGEEGEIAVRRPDPVMFLEYWRNPQATAAKFVGDWLLTGDRGLADADDYIYFVGREDDVITSSGYRIGPSEIEDCLMRHHAVAAAGVIGVPDALRTEIVTAFIVLRTSVAASCALAQELQQYVRERLGGHQYPRRVHFLDSLPTTVTGKLMRRSLRELALPDMAADEAATPGQLARQTIDFVETIHDIAKRAKYPDFTGDAWQALAQGVAIADFRYVGRAKETLRWPDLMARLDRWSRVNDFASTVQRAAQSGNFVFLQLQERGTNEDPARMLTTMTVFEFDTIGQLRRIDSFQ